MRCGITQCAPTQLARFSGLIARFEHSRCWCGSSATSVSACVCQKEDMIAHGLERTHHKNLWSRPRHGSKAAAWRRHIVSIQRNGLCRQRLRSNRSSHGLIGRCLGLRSWRRHWHNCAQSANQSAAQAGTLRMARCLILALTHSFTAHRCLEEPKLRNATVRRYNG